MALTENFSDDFNFADNFDGAGVGGNDKINAAQGDDQLTGGGGGTSSSVEMERIP